MLLPGKGQPRPWPSPGTSNPQNPGLRMTTNAYSLLGDPVELCAGGSPPKTQAPWATFWHGVTEGDS